MDRACCKPGLAALLRPNLVYSYSLEALHPLMTAIFQNVSGSQPTPYSLLPLNPGLCTSPN
ncbi:MAG: hypothetical protein F6K26_21190 [Moorea sp. SIO2I5]|nr:hypothetical protein [Moorena sp. SIO2I5]